MTDIAILVTEEFERSGSQSRLNKDVSSEGNQELGLVSCVSLLAQSLNKKFGQEKLEFVKWGKAPKTQVALAAYNGFFSA